MDKERVKHYIGFSWKKGFLIIAFFLFVSVLSIFITSDWLFVLFAWPFYLFPRQALLAAILEWCYAYIVATLLLILIDKPRKKNKK